MEYIVFATGFFQYLCMLNCVSIPVCMFVRVVMDSWAAQFHIPISDVGMVSLYPYQHSLLSVIFIVAILLRVKSE